MALNHDAVNALRTTGTAKFVDAMKSRTTGDYEKFCQRDSFGSTGYSPFLLLGFGTGSKWLTTRAMKALRSLGIRFDGELHEDSYKVKNTELSDDPALKGAQIGSKMAQSAAVYEEIQAFGILKNNVTGFDGSAMFGDHIIVADDGTTTVAEYNNDMGGSGPAWFVTDAEAALIAKRTDEDYSFAVIGGSQDTELGFNEDATAFGWRMRGLFKPGFFTHAIRSKQPLTGDNLDAVLQRSASFRSDTGLPMSNKPTHLIVPRALEPAAIKLLNMLLVNGGESNPYYGRLQLIVSDYL